MGCSPGGCGNREEERIEGEWEDGVMEEGKARIEREKVNEHTRSRLREYIQSRPA